MSFISKEKIEMGARSVNRVVSSQRYLVPFLHWRADVPLNGPLSVRPQERRPALQKRARAYH